MAQHEPISILFGGKENGEANQEEYYMTNNLIEINDYVEIELQLLASAYFLGDYYPLHQLIDRKSRLFIAFTNKKIDDIKSKSAQLIIDPAKLSENDQEEYRKYYPGILENIKKKYYDDLRNTQVPPPAQLIEEFAENAIDLGKFMAASSALEYIKALDKHIDRHLSNAIRILKSKEILALPEDVSESHSDESYNEIESAAKEFYTAIKLKKPTGPNFQYLGPELQFQNKMLWRKYEQHVTSNNLKEIVNFSIHYLSDASSFAAKISDSLSKGKIRKIFIKKLAELFSGGPEKYQEFISRYQDAVTKLATAEKEADFFAIQETILGTRAKTDELFHYFTDLMVKHPVSALVCCLKQTPNQKLYIAPYLAHEMSLVELLDIA